jgi:hypothetical protein
LKRVIILSSIAWVALISVVHAWLNLDLHWFQPTKSGQVEKHFRIGFLPVT